MSAHLKYLRYVLVHKWYVLVYGLQLRVSLWQLLKHDLSKFSPAEWFPYVAKFYGEYPVYDKNDPDKWQRRGYYGPTTKEVNEGFSRAWLHHLHHNPHHWQHWILINDEERQETLPIPDKYIREMVADWCGAGMALNKPDVGQWYSLMYYKIDLHPSTRNTVEHYLLELGFSLDPHIA